MTGLGLAVYHGLYSSIILIITGIRPSCPGWPISDRIPPIHQHDNNSWYSPHSSGLLIEKVRVEHCSGPRFRCCWHQINTAFAVSLWHSKGSTNESTASRGSRPMRVLHPGESCVYIWGDIITTLVWPAAHCWPPDSKYPELGGKRKREREGGGGTLWI